MRVKEFADPYGGAMTYPGPSELDNRVLDKAIEYSKYDAEQFDVSPYSNNPEDYEGQLQAITDQIIGDNAGEEVREFDDWYAIMTKALEPIIGSKLKTHMMGMAEDLNRLQHLAGIKDIEESNGVKKRESPYIMVKKEPKTLTE